MLRAALGLVLFLLSNASSMAGGCDRSPRVVEPPVSSVPIFDSELTTLDGSSFRGLGLGLSREEALTAVLRLGFPIAPTWSVSESHVTFCRGDRAVGDLRFNESGQLIMLELRPAFFEVNKVELWEFADQVFEHYRVRPLVVDDDMCHGDVTCLRGTTTKGENFLIARIGGEVKLLVNR
jgi:hypothetical protein